MTSRRIVLPELITKEVILNRLREVCPSLLTDQDPITLDTVEEMDYDKLKTIQLYVNPLNNRVCYFTKAYLEHLKKDLNYNLWDGFERLLDIKNRLPKAILDSQEKLKTINNLLENRIRPEHNEELLDMKKREALYLSTLQAKLEGLKEAIDSIYTEMTPKRMLNNFLNFKKNVLLHDTTKLYIPLYAKMYDTETSHKIQTTDFPEDYRVKYLTSLQEEIDRLKPINRSTVFHYLNDLTYSLTTEPGSFWKNKIETFKKEHPNACLSSGGSGARKRLEKLTVKELQERCVKRRLKHSGLRKAELIALLRGK